MRARLLLGPAGSGKTFRCLAEIRAALKKSADGPPLVMLAPKQATYQLERQLLAGPDLPGYTRLQILSFERLAYFVFERLRGAIPALLDEEGRLMVLRSLLARNRDDLKLFRASARMTGFAQQLSLALRELQLNELAPATLRELAGRVEGVEGLVGKLHDLATLLEEYLSWLAAHELQDADSLLARAAEALANAGGGRRSAGAAVERKAAQPALPGLKSDVPSPGPGFRIEHLWADGFAEFSEPELTLLAALIPHCDAATLALCVEGTSAEGVSWLSHWSVVRKTLEQCRRRFASLAGVELVKDTLPRRPDQSRFPENSALAHLEHHWDAPEPYRAASPAGLPADGLEPSLRVVVCADPEAEATVAAREVLRHVRAGGRYRDVSVVVRKLEGYHQLLQRVFSRYEIPYFLDRREVVAHHPLAELARNALRTVAFQWQPDDWLAALKTGLARATESELDRLENEALARGWRGAVWQKPLVITDDTELTEWVAGLQARILPPFQKLALAMTECENKPTGAQLAAALRELWATLKIKEQLDAWATAGDAGATQPIPDSVHATVWEQMNAWLANVELAFPAERLALRDWLPVLDAGLASLTVGVIPPALDQVLIGAIDRSRNPDIKVAVVLGLNETVFPAPPESAALLTDAERIELEKHNLAAGATSRHQLSRERFYGYIACTRARERLVLTCAQHDSQGSPLNPSPFLARLSQLFPSLRFETDPHPPDWRDSQHIVELVGPLLKAQSLESRVSSPAAPAPRATGHAEKPAPGTRAKVAAGAASAGWARLASLPEVAATLEQLRHLRIPGFQEALVPEMAARLYGPTLGTSVSRMEQFAACPFKFFVHSGLRAEERQLFELDIKEQGTFQHDVLALFHEQLRAEGKRWRDVTPAEACERVAALAQGLTAGYRDGLLEASEETRFLARSMTESLQDFVETLVGWMRQQYLFDPVAVELAFGRPGTAPPWSIDLEGGRQLALHGRIDRVDLCRHGAEADCVVVDYKSSRKQLDAVLVEHGVQLQLLAYLNVLRRWPNPNETFAVGQLKPAGVFYVNLRGKYDRVPNRREALDTAGESRRLAYRHAGRFDIRVLRQLDSRPNAQQGDQFNYRLTKAGRLNQASREGLSTPEFEALLDSVEAHLKRMGRQIFEGAADVSPFRKGATVACDQCVYQAICRIEPWTHKYRTLKKVDEPAAEPAGPRRTVAA